MRKTDTQAQPGDNDALALLAKEYRPALARYFARRGVPSSELEDVVQESFARLVRRGGVAELQRPDAYLFETAASVAIDYHRRCTVRHASSHVFFVDEIHASEDFSPERVLEGRAELNAVLRGLRELPERTRNVFVLVRLEQMRQAEVAKRLGISVSAVEKHLVKALVHLSECVGALR